MKSLDTVDFKLHLKIENEEYTRLQFSWLVTADDRKFGHKS